jgi:divalent metal cation (Fe/Co/Zn/Cd) transporter
MSEPHNRVNQNQPMQPKQAIARVSVTVSVRTRYVGNGPYVEVRLGTPRGPSLELAHQLTEVVERAISVELGAAETVVHVEPVATPEELSAVAVRAIADRLGLKVQNLNIFHVGRQARIELDLELAGTLTLVEAHRHAESLERSIVREMPNSGRVRIHLEPRNDEPRPAVGHV